MREGIATERLKFIYKGIAGRYDRQHRWLTAGSDGRGRQMLVEYAVSPGNTVLDCGAGTGSTGLLAARVAGANGKVILYDLSEDLLSIAKEKAERLGLMDRLEFRTGDMLALPFSDNSFDVVLSTYSMCPLYDPAQGALEVYRVVRPGGLVGVAHSAEPRNGIVRWCAEKVEDLVWYFPSISMGCRAVSVLPALERAGAVVKLRKYIGVPLWPFFVFVVQKPAIV